MQRLVLNDHDNDSDADDKQSVMMMMMMMMMTVKQDVRADYLTIDGAMMKMTVEDDAQAIALLDGEVVTFSNPDNVSEAHTCVSVCAREQYLLCDGCDVA